jgi:hypothetical protein
MFLQQYQNKGVSVDGLQQRELDRHGKPTALVEDAPD